MTIHDDLREVVELCTQDVPRGLSIQNRYQWDDARAYEALRFIQRHGPALLARQEGEDRLGDLHHAIRLVYGCVPNLPIDESTMDAATDALHNFCLMVGIHEVDVDSPIDDVARSGGGG